MTDRAPMDREYDTLRAEMLQLFTEQSHLAFATALSTGALLFAILQSQYPPAFGVAVLQLMLIGIAVKLSANYDKLYRIGTYMEVVHELGANSDHRPVGSVPAWHHRSRLLGGKLRGWKWGTGARSEALFLRLLGGSGLVFVLLTSLGEQGASLPVTLAAVLAFVLFALLWRSTARLYAVRDRMGAFELELWKLLDEEPSHATPLGTDA